MSADLTRRSAADLGAAIAAGEVTSEQVTAAHLDRIATVDGDREQGVHAFLHVAAEEALEERSEEERQGRLEREGGGGDGGDGREGEGRGRGREEGRVGRGRQDKDQVSADGRRRK